MSNYKNTKGGEFYKRVSVLRSRSLQAYIYTSIYIYIYIYICKGADNFLARPGRKQATATEDFDFDIFYL